ncbi:hypothetical protein VTI74DRAFT_7834 [Chaetomium olivicolor]
MAPQKFGSVRHKGRPAAARLKPFRDDTSLVALRYEQTKQAEPPIPLPPPRNPRRATAPASTTTASTTTPRSPIIVLPPLIPPPPQEEHPLFRSQRTTPTSQGEEWKRDSGAPTSSTITLRDEDAEDPVYRKFLDDIADASSVYSNDGQIADQALTSITNNTTTTTKQQAEPTAPPLKVSIPPRTQNPDSAVVSPSQSTATQTPTKHTSISKKLSISLGMKSPDGSKKLRKKMPSPSADRAASQAGAPETGPLRGSPKPKSPKSPHPTGTGSRLSAADQGHTTPPLSSPATAIKDFAPITTHIPEASLWDDLGSLSFSKRGSIMFGGKTNNPFKALMMAADHAKVDSNAPAASDAHVGASEAQPAAAETINDNTVKKDETNATATAEKPRAAPQQDASAPSVPSIRVSSMDVERESQKVRSLYESGDDLNWEDGARVSLAERLEPTAEVPSEEEENVVAARHSDPPSASATGPGDSRNPSPLAIITPRSANSLSPLRNSQVRREYERAGGIEDWEDLEGLDVDRYGFISPKRPVSRAETAHAKSSQLSLRRRRVLTKRPSTSYSASLPGGFVRPPSRKVSARSLNTYASDHSIVSRRSTRSSIRSATNHLPHNRDRRWMDEAGDMLSLQAGFTGISDDEKTGKQLEAQKRKEAERSEKWRKMATAVVKSQSQNQPPDSTIPQAQPHPQGQGMSYTFDTTSTKLIERTWKGIPDCWRSAAWYSFLASSAAKHHSLAFETEDHLISEFHRLQSVASPDDVQIDLDVPRTVNGHIMFRRRYRGGQRLLFRVLHAISLYFPEVGYVQGMASLAATLLCYFDEERAFVMLVRLWRYRGLERLYRPGFEELMAALGEFEGRWLEGVGRDVKGRLKELSIDATAYGTRWYLTLFNLSIPFPAQLRVWDVFMLLGDSPPDTAPRTSSATAPASVTTTATTTDPIDQTKDKNKNKTVVPQGLDVLHATAAALIHALRDVLLDSDFENAMKALTAWIPVRDEDLLMKVARAEWKRHREGGSSKSGGLVGRLWEWEWEREWLRDRERKEKEKEGREKQREKEEKKQK